MTAQKPKSGMWRTSSSGPEAASDPEYAEARHAERGGRRRALVREPKKRNARRSVLEDPAEEPGNAAELLSEQRETKPR